MGFVALLVVLILVPLMTSQECTDTNVRPLSPFSRTLQVFCVCATLCEYTEISVALYACSILEARTDCVIMLSSDLSPYTETTSIFVDTSMGPTTPGVILPYPGEDVTITVSPVDSVFYITSSNWILRGNAGGILEITLANGSGETLIEILGDLTNLQFGPGLMLTSSGTGVESGFKFGIGEYEDILIDGVVSDSVGGIFTVFAFVGSETTTLPSEMSSLYPHRIVFRDCEIISDVTSHAIQLTSGSDVLIEKTYISTTSAADVILIQSFDRVDFWNNVVEMSGLDRFAECLDTTSVSFLQNTFVCVTTSTTDTFFQLTIAADDITIANNLFEGQCVSSGAGVMIGESACGGSSCLGDSGSSLGCYRASDTFDFGLGGSSWTEIGCADGGVGLSVDFRSYGSKPVPFYYLGSGVDYDGIEQTDFNFTDDFLGFPRRGSSPTLGALQVPFLCYDFLSTQSGVCSGRGTCEDIDTCVCFADSATPFQNSDNCSCLGNRVDRAGVCDDYLCEDGLWGSDGLHSCGGHGECSDVDDTCGCDDNWESNVDFGNENGFCNDFKCADGKWGVAERESACNGHGTCFSTVDICVCDSRTGWMGEGCSVCDSHWDNSDPNACWKCAAGWIGDDCSESVADNSSTSSSAGFWDDMSAFEFTMTGVAAGAVVVMAGFGCFLLVLVCACFAQQKRRMRIATDNSRMRDNSFEIARNGKFDKPGQVEIELSGASSDD